MAASEHGNSQHSGYHQQSHHEIPHHPPPIDRRDSDMYDHNKIKPSEHLSSSHEPHSSRLAHLEYRESSSKPEEPPVSSSPDNHGSRVSILNSHQSPHQIDQHDHRIHVDGEDKGITPYSFRQERRSPPPPSLTLEMKAPEGPSQQQRPPTSNLDSPVRDNLYGNENHSPVSSSENQRKSSTDQHSNRGPSEMSRVELPKISFQDDQQQQPSSHSPSEQPGPTVLPRINNLDNNQSNSPSSPHDNDKQTLPSIRSSGGPPTRQVDEDYDDTPVDLANMNESGASSSTGQKRPFSPTPKVDNDIDNREDSSKRPKTSPPTPGREADALSPTPSERDRDQIRERRKSDESAGSATSPRSSELD
jgi:hypothetical protein